MIQALLGHSWKEQFRSAVWAKNLIANIFLGFAALMLTFYALLLGIFLVEILESILPDKDPLSVVNGVIIYYVAFEFFIRFFLQNVPVLSIQPYLHLPIKKAKMIHFMLRKSLLSPFNALSILFFTPFAIRVINGGFGTPAAIGWLLFIVGLAFMLHSLTILFKKKLSDHPNLIFYAFIVLAGIGALDYYQIFSLSTASSGMMDAIMATPYLAAIPWLASILFYYLNFNFLVKNTYPEEISVRKKQSRISGDFAFLKRFGHKGELMAAEIKLILRHKRPRNTAMFSAFVLFYGLIFYPKPEGQEFIFVFVGIFMTGIFFIQYGQFLLSWDSSFFDFVLIRKSTFRQYIEAKYYLFVLVSTIFFVLSLAYGYFGWKIVLINFCAYLFNIGINVFAVMRIAMYNPKKIDLNKRAAFNYEGIGAAQFLIVIPIMILPYLLYAPLAIFGYADLGIILTGSVGLIGLILRDRSLSAMTKYFIKNKHKIAAGFRAQ